MRAIQTTTWGEPPTYTADAAPAAAPSPTQIQLTVVASGLHRLIRSQALGQHYSARNVGLPYTPGADGVGKDSNGTLYYFSNIAQAGGFAEQITVQKSNTVPLSPSADPIQVAGLVNPGMASWMALTKRTTGLVGTKQNWSVVILGVTSQSGKVAVHFARKLGAGRVIGVARDAAKMSSLGLDEAIVLKDKPEESDWAKMGPVDVVLDYLYGAPAAACLNALETPKTPTGTQFVQIGNMAGLTAEISGFMLKGKNITIRGSGPGAWSMEEFGGEVEGLVRAVEGLEKQPLTQRKLEEIADAWANEKERTVFVP
jgi:NADPH:quinone reductase-like Zn-dependent oxidoreductase